jgi:hypothetical protein
LRPCRFLPTKRRGLGQSDESRGGHPEDATWFADQQFSYFANDRSLAQRDINIIAKWADAGDPEGNPNDAPPPVQWPKDGWDIQPDIVVNGPETVIPSTRRTM